ncbi:hypothetical protein D3C77_690340 [compost metagenome]
MSNAPRMSPEEFDSQVGKLQNLRGTTVQLARLILVDGLNHTEAAAKVGMSRQNVSKYMIRVNALLTGYPADWVRFDEWMPASLATEVRARLKEINEARDHKDADTNS